MIELELLPNRPQAALRMPAGEAAPTVARQSLRAFAEVLGADADRLDAAEAVLTRCVDRSVSPVGVGLRLDQGRLRADVSGENCLYLPVEVTDPDPLLSEVASERLVRRVIAMFSAGADLPSDRLTETLLIGELIVRHAPRHLVDGRLAMRLSTDGAGVRLGVGMLRPGRAERVLREAGVPAAESVIEGLADWVAVEPAGADGANPLEVLVVEVGPGRRNRGLAPVGVGADG